jgi:hypothetical protein
MPSGEAHGKAKLTAAKVRLIRQLWKPGNKGGRNGDSRSSQRSLARRFGVSYHQIWLIVHGKNWGHTL